MISSMYTCSPNVCSTHSTNGRIPNDNIQFKWGTNNYIVQMEGVQFWEPVQMRVDCNDTKQQKKNKNLSPQNFSTSIFLNLSDDLITKSIHKHSLSLWSETVQWVYIGAAQHSCWLHSPLFTPSTMYLSQLQIYLSKL